MKIHRTTPCSIDDEKRRYRVVGLAVAMVLHEAERRDDPFVAIAQQRDFRAKKSREHFRSFDRIGADRIDVDAGAAKIVSVRGQFGELEARERVVVAAIDINQRGGRVDGPTRVESF